MDIRDLSFTFPKARTPFFDHLAFTLTSPGINFLIGQNGAGKTTLADILTGLRPASGTENLPHDALYLNQSLPMLSSINVGDVVQLVLGVEHAQRHLTRANWTTLADQQTVAYLDPLWNQRYGTLSGGQRKLVQLLLFLQVDRDLVVLDEPTAAVDRQNVQILFNVMRAHPQRTYLIITHDVRDIQAFTNYHVLWLDHHRVTDLDQTAFTHHQGKNDFITAFQTV